MNLKKLLISVSFALLMAASNANAQETMTIKDINQFGWEYLGKKVKIYTYLKDVNACKHPSNRGKVCTLMRHDKSYFNAIFAKGFKSKVIKPLLENCVEMRGTILEFDTLTKGYPTTLPLLNIENIELADKSKCLFLN